MLKYKGFTSDFKSYMLLKYKMLILVALQKDVVIDHVFMVVFEEEWRMGLSGAGQCTSKVDDSHLLK